MSTRYQVYITPRTASMTYGDRIDVSDFVALNGIPNIRRNIDSSDYDFGVFSYGDIQLKAFNQNGYFNDQFDTRSIFKYSRDLAKVEIEFSNEDDDTITFYGLINEEATRINPATEEITFRILSRDSVIRNTKVAGGVVSNGMTAKAALEAILNTPRITSVLNFDADNINPALNFVIDVGTEFDNKQTKDVLNSLLLASNSVMVIDADGNMIVKDREEDTTRSILMLYGPYDIHARENIVSLSEYNSGMHRMFTSVRVNDTERSDSPLEQTFGYRQKRVSLPFITDSDTEQTIGDNLLDEFKVPKVELKVEIPTAVARSVELLDRVSVNYPLRVKAPAGKFLPIIGITKIGSTDEPLPYVFGSVEIPSNIGFKVIEIEENPNTFHTTLKLRQFGVLLNDGVINTPGNCIVGFAVIGESIICEGDTDPYNPSVIGAALIGETRVA